MVSPYKISREVGFLARWVLALVYFKKYADERGVSSPSKYPDTS